jgi:two-component sensor histidine kinase
MGKQRKRPPDDDRLSAIEQQLRATNQQLRASQQQLKTANQQLEAGNQQLRASEEELRKVNQDLRKRVKELDCLYGLSQLVERPDIVLDEIFQGLVELIPNGWRYPEITCARVIFEGKHFKTPNFKETKWRQLADIELLGKKAGILEVYYLKKKSELDEGPFLNEERELLNGLAERLGRIAQRIKDEQALKAAHQQLRADEQQLKVANQQLHANGQQLKAANQQLRANEQQLRAANQQLQAEVRERKKTEEKIKTTLKEKEVLLKEIHHRVKNNMQLISSILNIQSKHLRDEQALKMFKNGQSRIRSMALVHEKLYESKNLAGIDFAEYIRSITTYLFTLYKISEAVRLNVDIKDILLDINTAIPCALIVNEIVSNSLKYAFPEGIEGEIYIGLRSDKPDKFILIVKDNGIGFPKELDFRKTESLGMQLIIMLAGQLEGTVELDKSKGTAFTITFGQIKT